MLYLVLLLIAARTLYFLPFFHHLVPSTIVFHACTFDAM